MEDPNERSSGETKPGEAWGPQPSVPISALCRVPHRPESPPSPAPNTAGWSHCGTTTRYECVRSRLTTRLPGSTGAGTILRHKPRRNKTSKMDGHGGARR